MQDSINVIIHKIIDFSKISWSSMYMQKQSSEKYSTWFTKKTHTESRTKVNISQYNENCSWAWKYMSLIPVLGKRQEDLCEFKPIYIYRASSRTTSTTERNLVSESKKIQNNNNKLYSSIQNYHHPQWRKTWSSPTEIRNERVRGTVFL